MRLLDALKSSTEYLEKAGIEDAFADSEILALHAAGVDRLAAYMENPEISKVVLAKIRRLVWRRAKGEPVQYIVGFIEFLGLKIYVGKGVLIPRPETELLAEEAINTGGVTTPPLQILDLCTGSGCIALALAKGFPDADVYGTDVSKTALRYAKKNALENIVKNVTFLEGSLFSPLNRGLCFDLIVSNPPYVKRADIEGLQREIKEWEPLEALDGGVDGLDFYRRIFADAREHLCKGGKVVAELGFGQAMDVEAIALDLGYKNIEVKKDYAGIERIFKAEL
jgi:release factor glutamine methyltransferase